MSIAIVSIQRNGFNNNNTTLIILFDINHLFVHSEVIISIAVKFSIRLSEFICTQVNRSNHCYLILIIIFCLQLNGFKYSTHSFYLITVKWFYLRTFLWGVSLTSAEVESAFSTLGVSDKKWKGSMPKSIKTKIISLQFYSVTQVSRSSGYLFGSHLWVSLSSRNTSTHAYY